MKFSTNFSLNIVIERIFTIKKCILALIRIQGTNIHMSQFKHDPLNSMNQIPNHTHFATSTILSM